MSEVTMQSIFEANTDKVDLAVELLGELGDRTGKYVWKKFEYSPSRVDMTETLLEQLTVYSNTSASSSAIIRYGDTFEYDKSTGQFTITDYQTLTVNYTSVGDISVLQGKYFVINNTGTYTELYKGGDNPTANTALESSTYKIYFYGVYQITDVVNVEETKTFLDYVTADDENSYPNGALGDDGYWYEKVVEGTEYGMFFNEVDETGLPIEAHFKFDDVPNYAFRLYSSSYATLMAVCERLTIEANTIENQAFYVFLYNFKGKLKIKAEKINVQAFQSLGAGVGNSKVWISSKCTSIEATSYLEAPFYASASSTTVYCEHTSQPSDWSEYWRSITSSKYLTVIWGVTEEEFDAL